MSLCLGWDLSRDTRSQTRQLLNPLSLPMLQTALLPHLSHIQMSSHSLPPLDKPAPWMGQAVSPQQKSLPCERLFFFFFLRVDFPLFACVTPWCSYSVCVRCKLFERLFIIAVWARDYERKWQKAATMKTFYLMQRLVPVPSNVGLQGCCECANNRIFFT